MRVQFEVPKTTGQAFGKLLRTMLISQGECIKPIGVKITDSNAFIPDENIVSILSFCQSLSDLDYEVNESAFFPFMQNYTFTGKLMSSALTKGDVKVLGDNIKLLDTIDKSKPCNVVVVFNKGCGKVSSEDNHRILEDSIPGDNSYIALSSRYSESKVCFTVKTVQDIDEVTMDVTCKSGKESEKIKKAIESIKSLYDSCKIS